MNKERAKENGKENGMKIMAKISYNGIIEKQK